MHLEFSINNILLIFILLYLRKRSLILIDIKGSRKSLLIQKTTQKLSLCKGTLDFKKNILNFQENVQMIIFLRLFE